MLLNDTTKQLFEDKLLLLIHHHADVDAVASAIALQTVFEEAVICAPDKVSSHGQKIAEYNDIESTDHQGDTAESQHINLGAILFF